MTKKDIVRTISEEVEKLTQQQTKEVVQKTFDAIIDCLALFIGISGLFQNSPYFKEAH